MELISVAQQYNMCVRWYGSYMVRVDESAFWGKNIICGVKKTRELVISEWVSTDNTQKVLYIGHVEDPQAWDKTLELHFHQYWLHSSLWEE